MDDLLELMYKIIEDSVKWDNKMPSKEYVYSIMERETNSYRETLRLVHGHEEDKGSSS
jgi:hypothetical protein